MVGIEYIENLEISNQSTISIGHFIKRGGNRAAGGTEGGCQQYLMRIEIIIQPNDMTSG